MKWKCWSISIVWLILICFEWKWKWRHYEQMKESKTKKKMRRKLKVYAILNWTRTHTHTNENQNANKFCIMNLKGEDLKFKKKKMFIKRTTHISSKSTKVRLSWYTEQVPTRKHFWHKHTHIHTKKCILKRKQMVFSLMKLFNQQETKSQIFDTISMTIIYVFHSLHVNVIH